MRPRTLLYTAFSFLVGTAAAAQQRPIFDPDDFVDPREHERVFFISRLVAGGALNFVDDYRPTGDDLGFIFLTNSLYFSDFQLDYKRTETFGGEKLHVQKCGCASGIYFPTPPSDDAMPSAPPGGAKDTLQFAFYRPKGNGKSSPIMLRYRLTLSRQQINTTVTSASTREVVERLSGHESALGLDADTHFRVRGYDIWGSLQFARTVRSGTTQDRSQNELVYVSRLPGRTAGPILLRATLAVGGVSGRGASGINLVNPYVEALWHHRRTDAHFHLVYSPVVMRTGVEGWRTSHQLALFVERTLFAKLLGRNSSSE